jgi:hypothetical protein
MGHFFFLRRFLGATTAELVGEWIGWESEPFALRSTLDGAHWWGQVPLASIVSKLNRSSIHGALHKYVLNQIRLVRDPAAEWAEGDDPEKASRLVDQVVESGPGARRANAAAG